MKEYIVALDAMGGDEAPELPVLAALEAVEEDPSLRILLTGPEQVLREKTQGHARLEIVHAPSVIDMHDSPVKAVRQKKDSSLVVACDLVKQGRAQAALSAGSTGALLAAGIFVVGRLPGVSRPALAATLPTVPGKPFVLLDVGANADSQPQHLVEFGVLGKAYFSAIFDKQPKVGLLNIGTEEEKGNLLCKAAYPLMAEAPFDFAGNCEARDLLAGEFDVVVADGFTGNIALKTVEGTAIAMTAMLKTSLTASLRPKLGAVLAKPALRAFRDRMDYAQYGGAPLLGLSGIVIKAHGASNTGALKNAIRQAAHMISSGFLEKIAGDIKDLQKDGQPS